MREVVISNSALNEILSFSRSDKVKAVAAVKLGELGLPNKKTEHYRYFSIDSLLSRSYELSECGAGEISEGDRVEIVNGVVKKAPKGVSVKVVKEAFLDENHYDPVYYINHAFTKEVILIELQDGAKVDIKHIFDKERSLVSYRIALVVKEGAKAEIFEEFEGKKAKESLIFYGFDTKVEKGACLIHNRIQDVLEPSYAMIASHSINSLSGSKTVVRTYDMGEGKILHNLKMDLQKEAVCEAKHLVYTDYEAQRANIVKIIHKEERVVTSQEARHVLKDRSRAVFDAVIKVENEAKGAIAHQNNKSVLLNDKAHMVSKPQLEIYIDELEASHGSTTGTIDEEELFYLRTRGIKEKEAKKMIVLGFMKEIIDEIEDKERAEDIYERFEAVFKRDMR